MDYGKYGSRHTIFKNMCFSLSIIALFSVSGCGGGGGGTASPNDIATPQGSSQRVVRMRFDYDNNGTFEGLSEFFYDASGRITEERYSYVDDGVADLHQAGTLQSFLGREELDNTTSYTYDANGRLQSWVISDSLNTTTTSYSYDANDLITRVDEVNQSGTGAVLFSSYHMLDYSGQQLIRHTQYDTSDSSRISTYQIYYDGSGYVVTNQMNSNLSSYESLLSYSYLSNGLTDRIDEIAPDPSSTSELAAEYAYNAAGQVTRFDLHVADFRWERLFSADGKVSEVRVDNAMDGSVDAVVMVEWEQAACTPVILWNPRAFVYMKAEPPSPYLPGTGYWLAGHCDQGPL